MQLTYVFSELGNGLRRNISMTLAAIVTIFVSLTLVGHGPAAQRAGAQGRGLLGQQAPDHRLPVQPELRDRQLRQRRGHRRPEGADREGARRPTTRSPSWRLQSKQEAYDKWRRPTSRQRHRAPRLPVDQALGHAGVLLGAAQGPGAVPGHQERRAGPAGREHRARPARGAQADLLLDERHEVGRDRRSRRSWWSRRSCRSATRSGWRRSRGAARSGSCGWSAPPASTSSCRSCWRRWSPPWSGWRWPPGAVALFMYVVIYRTLRPSSNIVAWIDWGNAVVGDRASSPLIGLALTLLPTLVMTRKYLKV